MAHVRHEDGNVVFRPAQFCLVALMAKKAIVAPQGCRGLTINLGQALPIDPRRIPHNKINARREQKRERVLNNACPYSILVFPVEPNQLFVQVCVEKGILNG
jgi:hypothetical protein